VTADEELARWDSDHAERRAAIEREERESLRRHARAVAGVLGIPADDLTEAEVDAIIAVGDQRAVRDARQIADLRREVDQARYEAASSYTAMHEICERRVARIRGEVSGACARYKRSASNGEALIKKLTRERDEAIAIAEQLLGEKK
jgi:hypothetical protein